MKSMKNLKDKMTRPLSRQFNCSIGGAVNVKIDKHSAWKIALQVLSNTRNKLDEKS